MSDLSPEAKRRLDARLRGFFHGTDPIEIGSAIPLAANPVFAWAIQRAIAGQAFDSVWDALPDTARLVLLRIKRDPPNAAAVIEEFQASLADDDQVAFAELLCRMKDAPNPALTLTMEDVGKLVKGVRWLWRGFIPYGMLTEVVAEPGRGKSAFVLGGPVRSIVLGTNWPDGKIGLTEPGKVLWCDTESAAAIGIERIKNWGLPAQLILTPFPDDPFAAVKLQNLDHIKRIEFLINHYKIPLIVVDALRSAHGEDENSSRVAGVLQPLAGLVQRTNAATIVIHHSKKLAEDQEITANSSRGSNAQTALFRCQIGIDKPDPKSGWLRARTMKENLGINSSIGFLIDNKGVKFGPAPVRPQRGNERDRATAYLREHMKPGAWMPAAMLIENAQEQGISKNALDRAKTELGMVKDARDSHIKRAQGVWWWRMPGQESK